MKILEDMILERGIAVNEDILKAYLAENNMPLVAGEEQDVLAVPLLEKEDGTLDLWSDENIWRQAFQQRRDIRKGNLVIRDIEKNLGNITSVEANRIYDMTDGEYEKYYFEDESHLALKGLVTFNEKIYNFYKQPSK